jgi:hypothetical protein
MLAILRRSSFLSSKFEGLFYELVITVFDVRGLCIKFRIFRHVDSAKFLTARASSLGSSRNSQGYSTFDVVFPECDVLFYLCSG